MKKREIAGWTALIGGLVAEVLFYVSIIYAPPSSMRDKDGKKFTLFEQIFTPATMKAANKAALEESISKKLFEKEQAKKDSIAQANRAEQAKKDSIQKVQRAKKGKKAKKHAMLLNRNGMEMTAFATNAMKQHQKLAAMNHSRQMDQRLKV